MKTHILLIILTIITHTTLATIITVKQDGTGNYETIQEGINAATNGDTVLVYPGTYYENINYIGRSITVASLYLTTQDESYIHNTIIDGNQNGSCVLIISGEDENTVLCGFTVQNGCGLASDYHTGGGININGANPSIKNCIIQYNNARSGGGVYCRYTNTFFSDVTIRYNHSTHCGGGILCSYDGTTTFDPVSRCNIYLNYSSYGSDYWKTLYASIQEIYVDTFTVLNPDQHFIYSGDYQGFPLNDITIDIVNPKIEPVNSDLYINPALGDDSNNGLTPDSPLKTIAYAYHIIASDSLNPYSIFLSNGVYAPSTNGEKLPLNGRSYVSLIGENRDSTIFDADSNYFFFRGYGLMEHYTLENITFINGYGNQSANISTAGIFINACNLSTFNNLKFVNCISSHDPGIYSGYNNKIIFEDILLKDNQGGTCFRIFNSVEPIRQFHVKNCVLTNNGPDSNPETGEGLGLGISGSAPTPGLHSGKITNLQITENLRVPDPFWGPGMAVGLLVNDNVKVDLVNATIGNNVVDGEQGYAVNVSEGAELNVYNSIFYGDSLYEMSLGYPSGTYTPATANICYSNIEGGEDDIMNWYNQNTLNYLEGNINEDPLWDETGEFPYSLQWNSPCIDAGVPMYESGMDFPYIKIENEKIVLYKIDGDTLHIPSTDLAGNPRIKNGRIDMGAYEFQDTGTRVNNLYLQNLQESKIHIFPNPFQHNAFITFRLAKEGKVKVIVHNLKGQRIRKLMDVTTSPGEYTMTWNGKDEWGQEVKSGTYIVSFIVNGQKVALAKVVKKQP